MDNFKQLLGLNKSEDINRDIECFILNVNNIRGINSITDLNSSNLDDYALYIQEYVHIGENRDTTKCFEILESNGISYIVDGEYSYIDFILNTDKLIINGFICTNILYSDKSSISDLASKKLHQLQQKLEFTQFVPLSHVSNISDCALDFDCSDLKLKITKHEDGQDIIQLSGDLITYVSLYKKHEKDIIIDGYHNEKNFVYQKNVTDV